MGNVAIILGMARKIDAFGMGRGGGERRGWGLNMDGRRRRGKMA
jgi:hypothetical protein